MPRLYKISKYQNCFRDGDPIEFSVSIQKKGWFLKHWHHRGTFSSLDNAKAFIEGQRDFPMFIEV